VSGSRKIKPGPAPKLGEHSDKVLTDHGYSVEEISALRKAGVLG